MTCSRRRTTLTDKSIGAFAKFEKDSGPAAAGPEIGGLYAVTEPGKSKPDAAELEPSIRNDLLRRYARFCSARKPD